ncbi:MAG: AAA family ATPase [Myxococcota bacterium]
MTAIIGKNESGKTAFLEGLRRLNPIDGAGFDLVHDYPRTQLAGYRPHHPSDPEIGVTARLVLEDDDVREVERRFGKGVVKKRGIVVKRDYQNRLQVQADLDETALVRALVSARPDVTDDLKDAALASRSVAQLAETLAPFAPMHAGARALLGVATKLAETPLLSKVWKDVLAPRLPRVMIFGELDSVPSAVSLERLRDKNAIADPGVATALALLDVAGLSIDDLDPDEQSHEELRSRLENAAQGVTEELRRFWTQDQDLEVLVDVTPASAKDLEFAAGTPVLRIRIGSRKDRVSLPVSERSRGFNWFFSFLVRLAHLGNHATSLVILLDEPGRSLHAMAQADFLRFVEARLAPDHQLVYATHSPYLINASRLSHVRVVSRKAGRGTVVTSDLSDIDDESLAPLRASAGGGLAKSILPPGPCLVVRDPADLMWLRGFSEQVSKRKKGGLDPRWSIVPVGGAAGLVELALAAGYAGRNAVALFEPSPDESAQIARLAATRLVDASRFFSLGSIFNIPQARATDPTPVPGAELRTAEFTAPARSAVAGTTGQMLRPIEGPVATLEDLIEVQWWLALVREAYRLDVPIGEAELGSVGSLPDRTRAALAARGIAFDRLQVADLGLRRLGNSPIPPSSVDRFARLFESLNALLA